MARMHDIKFDLYAITCTCTCVCVQVCQPQKVEREPYTGPVIEIPSSKWAKNIPDYNKNK